MKRLVLFVMVAILLSTGMAIGTDGSVEQGYKLALDSAQIGDNADWARIHGTKFDKLVKDYWAKAAYQGLAERITKTFAGDEIVNGYRVGSKEIWIQKRTPLLETSIDVIVWHVERDAGGKLIRARGIGMDTHSVHPDSPAAAQLNKDHWEEKKATAALWESVLKSKKIDAKIEMNADNSFYWREDEPISGFADDPFTKTRETIAKEALAEKFGGGIWSKTAARTINGGLAIAAIGGAGADILEALEAFYGSGVVRQTQRLLLAGDFEKAKQYWEQKCIDDVTAVIACSQMKEAIAKATNVLATRTWDSIPGAQRMLFDQWEAAARALAGEQIWAGEWEISASVSADLGKMQISQPKTGHTINGSYDYTTGGVVCSRRFEGRFVGELTSPIRVQGRFWEWQTSEAPCPSAQNGTAEQNGTSEPASSANQVKPGAKDETSASQNATAFEWLMAPDRKSFESIVPGGADPFGMRGTRPQ